jgi:hypothetical protein
MQKREVSKKQSSIILSAAKVTLPTMSTTLSMVADALHKRAHACFNRDLRGSITARHKLTRGHKIALILSRFLQWSVKSVNNQKA